MKLVTVAEMQRAEKECGVPIAQLMENAGLAVAQEAWLLLGELAERRILVLAGPGNNGGDGLVAARYLKDWGADVIVALLKPRADDDPNYAAIVERQIPVIQIEEDEKDDYKRLQDVLAGAELIIDALLGTGRARAIEGPLAALLERLRRARESRLRPRLLAVDLPTGLDADTGAVDPYCVAADQTVTFAWSKVGLHVMPGSQYAGRVEVVDIGIAPEHAAAVKTELITRTWARSLLPERPPGAHKGTFGSALIVAGSPWYVGAAYLSCMGALRTGAGLVTLACARSVYPVLAAKLTESTFEPLEDRDGLLSANEAHAVARALSRGYESLLVGPGLSQGGYPQGFMKALLPMLKPDQLRAVIIDADGLNNLAKVEKWWRILNLPAIITPHPGELSRLCGLSVSDVQADRLGVARRCAEEWGLTVVLKGANTVVAAADGRARISPFANPALASGGTGDVLAGAIAGLVAQSRADPFEVASLGVFLHGLAGEHVREKLGVAGTLASDLVRALPLVIKDLWGG